MVGHEVTPIGPDQLGLASLRSTAYQRRQRLAPLCQHAPALAKALIGILIDENTVGGKDIRVVVSVVGARVDPVGVAVRELNDLLVTGVRLEVKQNQLVVGGV